MTEADATTIKNARAAHTKALVAANNAIGQQEYARRRAAEVKLEEEIADLRHQQETFRPTDDKVRGRARLLAEQAGDYIKVGADKKGKGGRTELNIGAYLAEANSRLRAEHRADIERQIELKTGPVVDEVDEDRTFTEAEEARIEAGIQETGKTRAQVISYLDRENKWEPQLEEVTVPDRETKEVPMRLADRTEPLPMNRDPLFTFGQENYDRFLTTMANRRG